MKIAAPVVLANIEGKQKLIISPHFGRAENFAIYDSEKDEIYLLDTELPERGKGRFFVSLVHNLGIDVVLVKNLGPGAFEALRSSGVKIYKVPENIKFFEDALSAFLEGKLKELSFEDICEEGHGHHEHS